MENSDNEIDIQLCLNRISILIKERNTVTRQLKDYPVTETDKFYTLADKYQDIITVIDETIMDEFKYLTTLL